MYGHTPHKTSQQLEFEDKSESISLALRDAARKVMDGEDRVSRKRQEEVSALRQSARFVSEPEFNKYRSYYQAQGRLGVARATEARLGAERKLAKRRIREAKLRLRAAYDTAEMADAQHMLAMRGLGALLVEMGQLHWLTFEPITNEPATTSRPWPDDPWSDTESEDSIDAKCFASDSDEGDTDASEREGSGD
jgi:hypothetical protein